MIACFSFSVCCHNRLDLIRDVNATSPAIYGGVYSLVAQHWLALKSVLFNNNDSNDCNNIIICQLKIAPTFLIFNIQWDRER